MNPMTLQTLSIMTGILTSQSTHVTDEMRQDAAKCIKKLMFMIEQDVEDGYKQFSSLIS